MRRAKPLRGVVSSDSGIASLDASLGTDNIRKSSLISRVFAGTGMYLYQVCADGQ